jgi:hypothetical protein
MQSPILSVQQASSCLLLLCQPTFSPKAAVNYLTPKLLTAAYLALYQRFFPSEWSFSAASQYSPSPLAHSEREKEFLCLVSSKLFPISEYYLENLDEERLHGIPILPCGFDWISDEQIDGHTPGVQMLLPLTYNGYYYLSDSEGQAWYASEFGVDWNRITHSSQIDLEKLKKLCAEADSPISALPVALAMLDLDTGNPWLDISYSMEGEVFWDWTVENVTYLAAAWSEAKAMSDAACTLIDWLTENPHLFEREVLTIWSRSVAK